ncbi:MAG TPA: hypothetical protein VIZ69_11815 [Thermoanaerobaculia bacterium]
MTALAARAENEAYLVLDDSLPVIDAALVHLYGYAPSEAEAFKDTLSAWFHRVIRRSGGATRDVGELREQLLFVACKYARAFRLAQARTGEVLDRGVTSMVNRPPEEVAVALLNRIRPRGARL